MSGISPAGGKNRKDIGPIGLTKGSKLNMNIEGFGDFLKGIPNKPPKPKYKKKKKEANMEKNRYYFYATTEQLSLLKDAIAEGMDNWRADEELAELNEQIEDVSFKLDTSEN